MTAMDNQIPRRLYKYRKFDARTLDMLLSDHLYFANPGSFNDPLDTRPSLEVDVDESELKEILSTLVKRRSNAQMKAAARTLHAKGPRTPDRIEFLSSEQASRLIQTIEHNATHWEADSGYADRQLRASIEDELIRRYDRGIVSLSERADCPLLWSHYGDKHRGICIGYSVRDKVPTKPAKVKYGGSRLVQASKVASMLRGDETARKRVDDAVLLQKGEGWRYEREWRLIGEQGRQESPLELEEIIFGCRFEGIVDLALFKTFEGRKPPVEFHKMRDVPGTFNLEKHPVDYDEGDFIRFPRRSISAFEEFDELPDDVSPGNP